MERWLSSTEIRKILNISSQHLYELKKCKEELEKDDAN